MPQTGYRIRIGICFPLSQVSPLVLEASSQWDEGIRAVSGSWNAGYGTKAELLEVSGVGPAKLDEYGEAFLAALKAGSSAAMPSR